MQRDMLIKVLACQSQSSRQECKDTTTGRYQIKERLWIWKYKMSKHNCINLFHSQFYPAIYYYLEVWQFCSLQEEILSLTLPYIIYKKRSTFWQSCSLLDARAKEKILSSNFNPSPPFLDDRFPLSNLFFLPSDRRQNELFRNFQSKGQSIYDVNQMDTFWPPLSEN